MCANSMLKHDLISKFFFATETVSQQQKVYNLIKPSSKLVYFGKKLVNDSNNEHMDSFSLRKDPMLMEIAVAEWYLIGEAYYCSIGCERSTFSTTAISRTDCTYLPYYEASNCALSILKSSSSTAKPRTEFVSESFWEEIHSGRLQDPGQTVAGVDGFIATLKKEKKGVTTAMTSQTHSDIISGFWTL